MTGEEPSPAKEAAKAKGAAPGKDSAAAKPAKSQSLRASVLRDMRTLLRQRR